MKIIISPAKKMNTNTDLLCCSALPSFLEKTEELMQWMQGLSFSQAKMLWCCSDKIAELNFNRLRNMNLKEKLTPALISYEGIQYQYMAPEVFSRKEWQYVQGHLRILSGFYGVLKPLDGVVPYRLEMQAKVRAGGVKNLYDFWGERLYEEVVYERGTDKERGSRRNVIVNLASKEYSRCVEQYLKPEDKYITCVFGEYKAGRVIQKGTAAKMARGEMARFMAENAVKEPETMKEFNRLGYCFESKLSSDTEYIFLKSAV